MNQQASPDAADFQVDQGLSLVDVAQFLRRHFARIVVWVALGCILAGGVVLILRSVLPRATIVSQTIRFTFDGCERGVYPNGIAFSPKDLLAAPVLETALQSITLPKSVKEAEVASRLAVYNTSRAMELLELEYKQKLSNSKLLQPERDALEREFNAKASSIQGRVYTLSFDAEGLEIPIASCERLVAKIPEAWASFAQSTRGVDDYNIAVVTAHALTVNDDSQDYLVKAELLRSISTRLAEGARQLRALPGGNLVRDSQGLSLAELVDEISANYRIRVLPNYINYLRLAFDQDPVRVREVFDNRIENQKRDVELSRSKAENISNAFRSYLALNSGQAVPVTGTAGSSSGAASPSLGLGGQMPAIMSLSEGFFDKVIAQGIQSKDVEYRQRLNERQIESAINVLDEQAILDFDKWILERISEVEQAQPVSLGKVQAESKITADRLQSYSVRLAEFHRLLSQRNLNAPSQLYRNDDPITVASPSAITATRAAIALVGCAALSFFFGVISGLAADRRQATLA